LSALVALAPAAHAVGTGSIIGTISPAGPGVLVGACPVVNGAIDNANCIVPSVSADPATGAYSITGLAPGDYVVSAAAAGYVETWAGGHASLTPWELVPGMTVFTVTDGSTATADITLVQAAVLTGTVSPVTAPGLNVMVCEVISPTASDGTGGCVSAQIQPDGTFTADVPPGATLIADAAADGYFHTYLGGCTWSVTTFCGADSTDVTKLTAPAAGQTLAIGAITLAPSATISGTITPAAAIPANAFVLVCALNTGDPTAPYIEGCGGLSPNPDGAYRVTSLSPGATYVVYACATPSGLLVFAP